MEDASENLEKLIEFCQMILNTSSIHSVDAIKDEIPTILRTEEGYSEEEITIFMEQLDTTLELIESGELVIDESGHLVAREENTNSKEVTAQYTPTKPDENIEIEETIKQDTPPVPEDHFRENSVSAMLLEEGYSEESVQSFVKELDNSLEIIRNDELEMPLELVKNDELAEPIFPKDDNEELTTEIQTEPTLPNNASQNNTVAGASLAISFSLLIGCAFVRKRLNKNSRNRKR